MCQHCVPNLTCAQSHLSAVPSVGTIVVKDAANGVWTSLISRLTVVGQHEKHHVCPINHVPVPSRPNLHCACSSSLLSVSWQLKANKNRTAQNTQYVHAHH